MIELLSYLDANGFSNYIASGGGRDFMRPISLEQYGIPREREFDYTAGAEQALEEAGTAGWTVVSMKRDWAVVF